MAMSSESFRASGPLSISRSLGLSLLGNSLISSARFMSAILIQEPQTTSDCYYSHGPLVVEASWRDHGRSSRRLRLVNPHAIGKKLARGADCQQPTPIELARPVGT